MFYINLPRFFSSISTYVKKPIKFIRVNENVEISGWIKAIRDVKRHTFLNLCDNSTPAALQIVITNDSETKVPLTFGSFIRIKGIIVQSPASGQDIEMQASSKDIEFVSHCDSLSYPFKPKSDHSLEYIRQFPHLRSGQDKFAAVLRVRDRLTFALHDYFRSNDFLFVDTPVITTNNCEGTNQIFKVNSVDASKNFFKTGTYLTVSAQLHLESLASRLGKVYTIGPIFRAESSNTRHHLAEFLMLEAELCPVTTIDQLSDLVKDVIVNVYSRLAASQPFNLDYTAVDSENKIDFAQRHRHILEGQFATLSYTQAAAVLVDHCDPSFKFGQDLGKDHERYLCEKYCGGRPLFVTNFPADHKPFYAKPTDPEQGLASSLDLLMPGVGEVCGGTLRETSHQVLSQRLTALNPQTANLLAWYLELRKFGYPPMAGFGIGYDRLVMNILGLANIRDATPFPRWHQSCQM